MTYLLYGVIFVAGFYMGIMLMCMLSMASDRKDEDEKRN